MLQLILAWDSRRCRLFVSLAFQIALILEWCLQNLTYLSQI